MPKNLKEKEENIINNIEKMITLLKATDKLYDQLIKNEKEISKYEALINTANKNNTEKKEIDEINSFDLQNPQVSTSGYQPNSPKM